MAIGGDAEEQFLFGDEATHMNGDLPYPLRVGNGDVWRALPRIVQRDVGAPLIIRHDLHAVAVRADLREVIRIRYRRGNGAVEGIGGRAGFDGTGEREPCPGVSL